MFIICIHFYSFCILYLLSFMYMSCHSFLIKGTPLVERRSMRSIHFRFCVSSGWYILSILYCHCRLVLVLCLLCYIQQFFYCNNVIRTKFTLLQYIYIYIYIYKYLKNIYEYTNELVYLKHRIYQIPLLIYNVMNTLI